MSRRTARTPQARTRTPQERGAALHAASAPTPSARCCTARVTRATDHAERTTNANVRAINHGRAPQKMSWSNSHARSASAVVNSTVVDEPVGDNVRLIDVEQTSELSTPTIVERRDGQPPPERAERQPDDCEEHPHPPGRSLRRDDRRVEPDSERLRIANGWHPHRRAVLGPVGSVEVAPRPRLVGVVVPAGWRHRGRARRPGHVGNLSPQPTTPGAPAQR